MNVNVHETRSQVYSRVTDYFNSVTCLYSTVSHSVLYTIRLFTSYSTLYRFLQHTIQSFSFSHCTLHSITAFYTLHTLLSSSHGTVHSIVSFTVLYTVQLLTLYSTLCCFSHRTLHSSPLHIILYTLQFRSLYSTSLHIVLYTIRVHLHTVVLYSQ